MSPRQHIAELGPLFHALGLTHVVISPGSRNAPLIQLFTARTEFTCHSMVDERSAGYAALGMAKSLNEPVAVVTTSGTAVLNLGPAVAEAWHQHIPLIVLTADRPGEVISPFNNQMVDQQAPFFPYCKGFYELPPAVKGPEELTAVLDHVHRLAETALEGRPGPAHFNVPLEEPLYGLLPPARREFPHRRPEVAHPEVASGPETGPAAESTLMILAGMAPPDPRIRSLLEQISLNGQAVVVAENISNMGGAHTVSHPELVLASRKEKGCGELKPDLVLSLGGQVVSKRLKLLLQSEPVPRHYHLEDDPGASLQAFAEKAPARSHPSRSRFRDLWITAEQEALHRSDRFFPDAPFCNLTAVHEVLSAAPGGITLHLGNSAVIRYAQLVRPGNGLACYSNRGTSGIDGSVSSAVGAAMVDPGLHLLLVGDLSFVYDSNALWNEKFPSNLRTVVLNDGGGGIFRLLEGPGRMDFFEEFSVTRHPVSLELLARAFGRGFRKAASAGELAGNLEDFFLPSAGGSILEIDTRESENSRIFEAFIQSIATHAG